MATYSPDMLAALRHRYEDTDQPMTALAADFGIGITTLQNLVRKKGWAQRSKRMRDCPSEQKLLADALAAPLPERETAAPRPTSSPPLPVSGEESEPAPAVFALPPAPDAAPYNAPATSALSPAERIEALVLKEVEAEEAIRAALGMRPRPRHDAERCARTLSVLTQTLKALQGMRVAGSATRAPESDNSPKDIDALREELARRIMGLIENQVGSARMALDKQVAGLSDDELRELIQVGRERGMQALLRAPVEEDQESG